MMSPLLAELTHRVHNLDPYLIQFGDGFGVRYYGLAYVAGFFAAWWILLRAFRTDRSRLNPEGISNLLFYLIIGTMVGGRVGYYLFYRFDLFQADPLILFRVWEGGMASHGAFIGIFIAISLFAWRNKLSPFHLGDLVCVVAPIGICFGRIANFINGELWGKVTDVSWAWIFPSSAAPGIPVELIAPRHPSQLYQAGLEGLLLALWLQWRFWLMPPKRAGQLAGEFFIGYAVMRSIGEIFREPDAGLILGLSRGTFYSLFIILAGVLIIYLTYRRNETAPNWEKQPIL